MATDKNNETEHFDEHGEVVQAGIQELFELLYDELQKIAHARRREWHGNITINTTGLLHETYLKFVDSGMASGWKSKSHFFAAASRAMRHILINYARDRNRLKRGGGMEKISLENTDLPYDGEFEMSGERTEILLLLGEALKKLDDNHPRLSQIVECRVFGGLTIRETAEALDISPITVTRGWSTARLWLNREMQKKAGD